MKYPKSSPSVFAVRVQELPTVTATALKNNTADIIEQVAATGAIVVTRHDKPRIVLLSIAEYERLAGSPPAGLEGLRAKYQTMLDRMQDPEQKAGALRAFNATSEELGRAAVAGAMRNQAGTGA